VPLAHFQNGTPNAHCQSLANGELRGVARLTQVHQKLNFLPMAGSVTRKSHICQVAKGLDLYTDFAIYQFLHVTQQQAHLITSGMMFGRKARLLDDLIRHSDDPRKPKLLESFNKIRAAKRDIITHSYVGSDAISVWYLERNTAGPFKAEIHSYSAERLQEHIQGIANAATDFYNAWG
jgi:hypothetical protein